MLNRFLSTHPVSDGNHADADLTTRIAIALTNHHRAGWRRIHLIVQHGVVMLRGEVSTSYNRQLVVAVTRHVAGVRRVDDVLAVSESPVRTKDPIVEQVDSPSDDDGTAQEPAKRHAFYQIPVLAESLEDILAAHEASASATS